MARWGGGLTKRHKIFFMVPKMQVCPPTSFVWLQEAEGWLWYANYRFLPYYHIASIHILCHWHCLWEGGGILPTRSYGLPGNRFKKNPQEKIKFRLYSRIATKGFIESFSKSGCSRSFLDCRCLHGTQIKFQCVYVFPASDFMVIVCGGLP